MTVSALKYWRSRSGMGVILLATVISVVMALGTGSLYLMNERTGGESARRLNGVYGDEKNRNAIVHTKRLLEIDCIVETATGWELSPQCSPGPHWVFTPGVAGTAAIDFVYCSSLQRTFPEVDTSNPTGFDCVNETSRVTFYDKLPDGRVKVTATTAVRGGPRSTHALLAVKPPPAPKPCVPNLVGEVLDFEQLGVGTAIDSALNSQLQVEYGVSFESIAGGTFKVADLIFGGDGGRPNVDAWMSILCPGRANKNRLCFDSDPGRAGRNILTMTAALNTRRIELKLNYVVPVQQLSFQLADVDGGERWAITTADANGTELSGTQITRRGYGGRRSGNSALTEFSVSRNTPDISSVRIVGTKRSRIFGFGFDNFTTGLSACSP